MGQKGAFESLKWMLRRSVNWGEFGVLKMRFGEPVFEVKLRVKIDEILGEI